MADSFSSIMHQDWKLVAKSIVLAILDIYSVGGGSIKNFTSVFLENSYLFPIKHQ
jgi:hypothetical protein